MVVSISQAAVPFSSKIPIERREVVESPLPKPMRSSTVEVPAVCTVVIRPIREIPIGVKGRPLTVAVAPALLPLMVYDPALQDPPLIAM